MIDKVTFTGREEMLVKPMETIERKFENIISESTILPKMAQKAEETVPAGRPVFVSPFAPLGLKKVGEILDKII